MAIFKRVAHQFQIYSIAGVAVSTNNRLEKLTNPQIASVAAFLLGGDVGYVDTEDIAIEADKIAPGRFRWKKHPENIDLEKVRQGCEDAKRQPNGLLIGSPKKGWMLTQSGLAYAKATHGNIDSRKLERKPISDKDRRIMRGRKARLLESAAYEKYAAGQMAEITTNEAEAFFRLDEYITGDAREKKIVQTCNMFSDDQDLGELTMILANRLREE